MRRTARRAIVVGIGLASGLQAQSTAGLVAAYGDGAHRVRMVTASPSFRLAANESVHPALKPAFDAEWRGEISILRAGSYEFEAGDAEILVSGRRPPLKLDPGRHPILVRYRRKTGPAALRLQWKADHFPLEPVPGSLLSHAAAEAPSRQERLAEQGRGLVEEFGCVNCHAADSSSLEGRRGPDLTGIGSRVRANWLYHWLGDPTAVRPGAVMPGMSDDGRRRDVASYLKSAKEAKPAEAAKKPRLSDVATGNQLFGAIGCAACHQQDSLSLEGLGSKTDIASLAAFLKNPAARDPGGRMPSLLLSAEEAFQMAAFLMESRTPSLERAWQEGDPARGKEVLATEGCLACHAMRDPEPLINRQRAPKLRQLAPGRGCLASQPAAALPHYRLSAAQREAIEAFLRSYAAHPDVSPAPVHTLSRRLEQFRCVACHQSDDRGPTATLSEATPPLTGAGDKLRTAWIEKVLMHRERSRPWMELRMPDYDPAHAKSMPAAFAKAAGVEPGDGGPAPVAGDAVRNRGAGMIGTDPKQGGMACIGCHDWGRHKSLGEEGPQLADAAERLRYDWYRRWMLNPARILSGTSMPNYFTSMAPARADEVLRSLWAALEWGEKMPLPAGLGKLEAVQDAEALPAPGKESVVVRWDMPEATPAAIAVGMPGSVSYCFDAGESRLRYAWLGGFLDMSETLFRKVDQNKMTPTAKLTGEVFYRSDGFPWRAGAQDRVPQARYRGYRVVDGHPEFHYQVDGTDIYERIVPTAGRQGIVREFRIPKVTSPLWFVPGPASGVRVTSSLGGGLQVPQGADVRFTVTIEAENTK